MRLRLLNYVRIIIIQFVKKYKIIGFVNVPWNKLLKNFNFLNPRDNIFSGRTGSKFKAETESASGSNLTFESLLGFPRFAACASLRDARRKIHHRFVGRSASA